jgi:hypothetical protein
VGLLTLDNTRTFSSSTLDDIVRTICAMANIAPRQDSFIYVGVTDKDVDAQRVQELDGIEPVDFEGRKIVGIGREAKAVSCSLDSYVMRVKDIISTSGLTDPVRIDTLSKLDCFVYRNLDVLRIVVPGQSSMSFIGDQCFDRQASSTIRVPVQAIQHIARRFQ